MRMTGRILHFIKYNNAFTLALLFTFLSTGTIFAANEDLRESVISSSEHLVAVDNTYIRTVDLANFDPEIEILDVTEADEHYTVTYRINSIEVVDGVWTSVSSEEVLTVAKALLGDNDLGLYVAEELKEVSDNLIQHLKEVQSIELTLGEVPRVTVTEYDGLIGRMLDPTQNIFVGYDPVIPPEKEPLYQPRPDNTLASAVTAMQQPAEPEDDEIEEPNEESPSPVASSTPDTTAPVITLNGDTSVLLQQNATYTELGARALDDIDGDITDTVVISGNVNPAEIGTFIISYAVADTAGNTSEVTRTVQVVAAETAADDIAPVITLLGSTNLELTTNQNYVESGATAIDNLDGDITDSIEIISTLNTAEAGDYEVMYTSVDSAGNSSTAVRSIKVTATNATEPAALEVVE